MSSLIQKMVRAARLDATLYEEVEAELGNEALLVLGLASLANGVAVASGAITYTFTSNDIVVSTDSQKFAAWLIVTILSFVSWFAWAHITAWIGTRLFADRNTWADWGETGRTLGFAAAPGALRFLAIIPGIGQVIYLVLELWMFAAMVVAIRQALDFDSTWRAVFVCATGAIPYLLTMFLVYLFLLPKMVQFLG